MTFFSTFKKNVEIYLYSFVKHKTLYMSRACHKHAPEACTGRAQSSMHHKLIKKYFWESEIYIFSLVFGLSVLTMVKVGGTF